MSFWDSLVARRRLALVVLGLFVLAMMPGANRSAVPDNALTVWFLESDPQLQAYDEFQESFGNDEVVLLMVEPPGGVLSEPGRALIGEVSAALEQIEGVERVHSILSARDVWRIEDGIRFGAATEAGLDRLVDNPLFEGRFLSEDGTLAMLWVQMAVMGDFDARRDAIVTEVAEVADEVLGSHEHALGGIGIIYSGLNLITQHDFGLFLGLGYLVIFVVLGWLFRSWRLVLATIGVVTVGTLVALGVYGYAGHQLNMVTVVLPTLIVVLGLADAIHMPAAFVREREQNPEADRHTQAANALRKVFVPCLLTTVTTMAGFLALSSSPMAVIRHLGIYAAIGVGAALLASLVLMAWALAGQPQDWRFPRHRLVDGILDGVEGLLHRKRPLLIVLTLALCGLAGWGATTVVADTYTIGYLPDDHRVVTDHQAIEERWGNYSLLDFLVRPADPDARVDSPELIEATHCVEQKATELPAVSDGYGLHSVYRRSAEVLGIPVADDVPLARDLVAQLGLLLEIQGFEWIRDEPEFAHNALAPVMTEDGTLGRMTLVGGMMSAKEVDTLLADVREIAAECAGDAGTIEPAGYPPLYARIVDYATSSQIRSFYIALGIIFCLMLAWLRSPRLALVSLVPNVFPVLVMLGVMGAMQIRLDIATATVAAIVIGVSIDDTVHFLLHWREAERAGKSWEEALHSTLRGAGAPAFLTTLLLVVGYPVMMLADVKTVVAFGLLTTVAAIAALFGDLVLLPLLLRVVHRRAQP
jgi:uncharacterized protein